MNFLASEWILLFRSSSSARSEVRVEPVADPGHVGSAHVTCGQGFLRRPPPVPGVSKDLDSRFCFAVFVAKQKFCRHWLLVFQSVTFGYHLLCPYSQSLLFLCGAKALGFVSVGVFWRLAQPWKCDGAGGRCGSELSQCPFFWVPWEDRNHQRWKRGRPLHRPSKLWRYVMSSWSLKDLFVLEMM